MSRSARNHRVEALVPHMRKTGMGATYRTPCPFCEDDGHKDRKSSFVLYAGTGVYFCYRCGTSGKLKEPPQPGLAGQAEREPGDITTFDPPVGFLELSKEPACSALTFDPHRDYLKSRGMNIGVIADAKIGVCQEEGDDPRWLNRIIVPLLADDGETWFGWSGRSIAKTHPLKYLYPPGMTRAAIVYNRLVLDTPTDEPALCVEGVFDTFPFYDRAVAILGKPSQQQEAVLTNAKRPVCIVFDGDAWQEAWILSLKLRFAGQRAGHVRLPPRADPDEVDRAWLLEEAKRSISSES